MSIRHLHLLQLCIQYSTYTDYTMFLTLYTLTLQHPNISMHILHTVLYTFPNVLARRICLTIKRFFSWLSFLAHDLNVWFRGDIESSWDASHSEGLKGKNCTHFMSVLHLLATIVKIVRKANKQMNRRQWNEGNRM